MNKGLFFTGFILLIGLALFLRTYHLGTFSLFSDERSSVLLGVANTNQGGLGELMRPDRTFTPMDFWAPRGIAAWFDADARGDVSGNSLVHDMMLKLFAFLFGKSDESMRSVSVLFNILTIWVMFRWSRQIMPNKVWTLVVLLFATIDPFFIIFGQQVRNYTTSLFFATASNYLFWLLIIRNQGEQNFQKKNFYLWVFSSIGALFSTYLTALVFIGQFVYMAIFVRSIPSWKNMMSGFALMLVPLIPWFIWGPGQYFWAFQADAAKQLLDFIHANGEVAGWLELSTPANLYKRTISIWSDQFAWTNDLYAQHGYKVGSVLFFAFVYLIYQWIKDLPKEKRGIYSLGLIQLILPVIVLFAAAVNSKTTSGFFLRYASFGLPFGIFMSVAWFEYVLKKAIWYRILASLFLFFQTYHLIQLFLPLYSDQKQKYTYSQHRGPNPYPKIAAQIKANYQVGDTVIYPSNKANLLNSIHMRDRIIDPLDAQNVNLYFDGNETFIQRVDPDLRDSILIKRRNGQNVLIFDFKKGKYRY